MALKSRNSQKFSPSKVSRYTVCDYRPLSVNLINLRQGWGAKLMIAKLREGEREDCSSTLVLQHVEACFCGASRTFWRCRHLPMDYTTCACTRDTHIMLFKVPIMLCSDSQHQANYAHHFVPIMLTIISTVQT